MMAETCNRTNNHQIKSLMKNYYENNTLPESFSLSLLPQSVIWELSPVYLVSIRRCDCDSQNNAWLLVD